MNFKETYLIKSKNPQRDADKLYKTIMKMSNTTKSQIYHFIQISLSNKNKESSFHFYILKKLRSIITCAEILAYSYFENDFLHVINSDQERKIDRSFDNLWVTIELYDSFVRSSFKEIAIPQNYMHKKNLIKKVKSICGIRY